MRERNVFLLLVGLAVALVIGLLATREPEYKGKRLSEWVEKLGRNSLPADFGPATAYNGNEYAECTNALRHIQTQALPYLIEWICYEPGPSTWLLETAGRWLPDQLLPTMTHREARAHYAALALGVLHPENDTNLVLMKLKLDEFRTYFVQLHSLRGERNVLSNYGEHASSPRGGREVVLRERTSPLTPYEDQQGEIVVFDHGKANWRLIANGHKGLGVKWVSEDVLHVNIWPGTRVELNELINVKTGRILYRSAVGHYDRLE